ncbi:hypothetical protein FB451DRAFT_1241001, partial [Mycena latifolia]
MTEYDYSPQARARAADKHQRTATWAHATPSGPGLPSPFAPSSTSGSGSGYGGPSTYCAPTHLMYRPPTPPGASHAVMRSQVRAPSVTPSESISQAPPPSSRSSTRSSSVTPLPLLAFLLASLPVTGIVLLVLLLLRPPPARAVGLRGDSIVGVPRARRRGDHLPAAGARAKRR